GILQWRRTSAGQDKDGAIRLTAGRIRDDDVINGWRSDILDLHFKGIGTAIGIKQINEIRSRCQPVENADRLVWSADRETIWHGPADRLHLNTTIILSARRRRNSGKFKARAGIHWNIY